MPRITLTLDDHTVEALAARIDDATRSLEDVASQVLYEAARQVDEEVGYRAPCKCGWLEKFADEPDIPIHFDTQTNEYWITSDPAISSTIVRYCFSCGGAAPTSKRHLFFARIPLEESHRLSKLCEGIASFEDAINRLGPPNFDMPGGMMVPAKEGVDEEKMIVLRTITYRQLSDTADLYFTQHRNENGVSLMLVGKSLEQARSAD